MRKVLHVLVLSAASFLSAQSQEQSVAHRFGLNINVMFPTGTAGDFYKTGYNIGIPFYFRLGEPVEGRLRIELGHFDGKTRDSYSGREVVSADTRYVGYDWLIQLGQSRDPGVDFLVGIGGAHWNQTRTFTSLVGTPSTNSTNEEYGNKVAFVLSLGFIFHFTSHMGLEAKQMFSSVPNSERDFHDADLSHTSLGLAFRF